MKVCVACLGGPCGLANVKELWIKVKDGLGRPLRVALHAMAGLPPPIGLLQLPTELKEHILDLLPNKVRPFRIHRRSFAR